MLIKARIKAGGAHVASHHLLCLRRAHIHTLAHKNIHAHVCCWAESPLWPQFSVDTNMCLRLTLEREFDHVALFFSSPLSKPLPSSFPLLHTEDNHRGWTSRSSERQRISLKRWIFQKATKTPGCLFSHGEPNHLQGHDRHVFRWFSSSYWAGYSHKMEQTASCCYWQPLPWGSCKCVRPINAKQVYQWYSGFLRLEINSFDILSFEE